MSKVDEVVAVIAEESAEGARTGYIRDDISGTEVRATAEEVDAVQVRFGSDLTAGLHSAARSVTRCTSSRQIRSVWGASRAESVAFIGSRPTDGTHSLGWRRLSTSCAPALTQSFRPTSRSLCWR